MLSLVYLFQTTNYSPIKFIPAEWIEAAEEKWERKKAEESNDTKGSRFDEVVNKKSVVKYVLPSSVLLFTSGRKGKMLIARN